MTGTKEWAAQAECHGSSTLAAVVVEARPPRHDDECHDGGDEKDTVNPISDREIEGVTNWPDGATSLWRASSRGVFNVGYLLLE
jgi:hypothetical protein